MASSPPSSENPNLGVPATDDGLTLDHEGLHTSLSASTITTWLGARVDVLDARASDILIGDIAHALARQVRYNGHVSHHLSVARHSIFVSLALQGTEHELWGLLHDASETYLGDMVKPLKHHPSMHVFREAEARLDRVIAERFALPYPMPAEVKEADRYVTVELEIGAGRRWSNNTTYQQDETAFLMRYGEFI